MNNKITLPIILIAACAAVAAWWFSRPAPWKPAEPVHLLDNVPKVELPLEAPLKVYAPAAKKKLRLPKPVQDDPNKAVVAATEVRPDPHSQIVVTIVDAATGEVETQIQQQPLPWFATARSGEVRLDYGYKRGQAITRLSAHQDLLQVKALRAGLSATVDSAGDLFVGVGLGWRW